MTGMILLENFKHLSSMTKTIMVVTSTFQVNHSQYLFRHFDVFFYLYNLLDEYFVK